jgi:hypothetical protein
MRTRVLALAWLAVAAAVWCGFFDLYVSRGARQYLQEHAEYELHLLREEPSMVAIMARARRDGVMAATLWATAILLAGWATIRLGPSSRTESTRADD